MRQTATRAGAALTLAHEWCGANGRARLVVLACEVSGRGSREASAPGSLGPTGGARFSSAAPGVPVQCLSSNNGLVLEQAVPRHPSQMWWPTVTTQSSEFLRMRVLCL